MPFRSKLTIILYIHVTGGEIIAIKGTCNAGHLKGAIFPSSYYYSGGVYGFFYHDLFPSLRVMQFGGTYAWSSTDELAWEYPDRRNAVTIKLTKE